MILSLSILNAINDYILKIIFHLYHEELSDYPHNQKFSWYSDVFNEVSVTSKATDSKTAFDKLTAEKWVSQSIRMVSLLP